MKTERRTFELDGIELRKADDGKVTIRGHAAVFNQLSPLNSGFREKIEPGAFADDVDGDVLAFWNHNSDIVLGRTPDTLRLKEDDVGLAFEIDPPTTRADLIENIERNEVRGTSFGFQTIEDSWEKMDGVDIRTLIKVRLLEVSPTPLPWYPQTDVTIATRSRDAWYADEAAAITDIDLRRRRLRLLTF